MDRNEIHRTLAIATLGRRTAVALLRRVATGGSTWRRWVLRRWRGLCRRMCPGAHRRVCASIDVEPICARRCKTQVRSINVDLGRQNSRRGDHVPCLVTVWESKTAWMSECYVMEDVRGACVGSYCSIQPVKGKKEWVSAESDGWRIWIGDERTASASNANAPAGRGRVSGFLSEDMIG